MPVLKPTEKSSQGQEGGGNESGGRECVISDSYT